MITSHFTNLLEKLPKGTSNCRKFLLVAVLLSLTSYLTMTNYLTGSSSSLQALKWYPNDSDAESLLQRKYARGQVWINYDGPLEQRLMTLNDALDVERLKMIKRNITYAPLDTVKYVYFDRHAYLRQLAKNVKSVVTIYLEMIGPTFDHAWNSQLPENKKNFVLGDYYMWQAEQMVCGWYLDAKYRYIHEHPCIAAEITNGEKPTGNPWLGLAPQPIDVTYVRVQLWGGVHKPYVTYVHVISGGSITNIGEVFGADYKIAAPSCATTYAGDFYDRNRPKFNAHYEEVFVISQFWGESYYHVMMEDLPRLAPFLAFLRRNPQIKIHMVEPRGNTLEFLRALGIDPARLVSGHVASDMIYLPKSTDCGNMSIFEGQLLSHEFHHYIDTQLPSNADNSNKAWKSIVLIKRSGSRRFERHDAIADVVSKLATKYGYKYELFADNPSPSATETMLMFYRARVIVAPHGAGLSNTLFARPGTFVIEGACAPLDLNYCYLMSTYHLGLIYYGVPVTGNQWGPIDVDPQHVGDVLRPILDSLGAPVA